MLDQRPFADSNPGGIMVRLMEGAKPASISKFPLPASLKDLMRSCWHDEPGARPNMEWCCTTLAGELVCLGAYGPRRSRNPFSCAVESSERSGVDIAISVPNTGCLGINVTARVKDRGLVAFLPQCGVSYGLPLGNC